MPHSIKSKPDFFIYININAPRIIIYKTILILLFNGKFLAHCKFLNETYSATHEVLLIAGNKNG